MNLDDLAERVATIRDEEAEIKREVRVCMAAGCQSCGADAVFHGLKTALKNDAMTQVKTVGCMGLCCAGPLVQTHSRIDGEQVLYQHVQAADVPDVVAALNGPPLERLHCPTDLPFFTRQQRIVLENSGVIDPERLQDYLLADGYVALVKALTQMDTAGILTEINLSGLRGRGGGGYPTGLKWSTVAKTPPGQKFVICNADEGDPGAFMDRAVLESDPFRVIEGMTLAAYAVGANRGYVYIRAEYPLAVERLKNAIQLAKKRGYLGNNICETPFSFDIDIRLGAGAFVCGEETALMASIEGQRGQPRPRPPYPAEAGLWGYPTLINNVETFANIPPIIRKGGRWFAGIGTERSKGTKVFALAGRITHTGLIEVAMGTPLREIIEQIGGGVADGRAFKAVQTGGPSGGCLPAALLDLPVDYDTLKEQGSIMGSGGMIIMDDSSCMVDVARYFMEFCMSESCGKCVPCRAGTQQMHALLQTLAAGHGRAEDLDLLQELCEMVRMTSLCGLGQSAPNPVLSTLRHFRSEYTAKLLPAQSNDAPEASRC